MSTALYSCYQANPASASTVNPVSQLPQYRSAPSSNGQGHSLHNGNVAASSVPRSLPLSLHLAAAPSPAILSISPPVNKQPRRGSNGTGVNSHHASLAAMKQSAAVSAKTVGSSTLPFIHSSSVIDTFKKCLSDLDLDDCEPAGENAFLVCDLKRVWDRYTLWQRELGDRVEAFFAVKCNPDPVIIQLMARLGLGFDCASHQEIANVLSFGVDPDKIIYANPCKASSFIRHAAKQDVRMMTFDNADELVKVAKFHPKAKMVLRILTDDSGSLCRFGLKFGAPLAEVRGLLEKAKELNVEVIGISFHVGSGCTNPNLFGDAVARARWAFDVAKELGFSFDFLDLGGGFDGDTFVQIASVLRPAIEKHFPREEGVRVIAEPGRYFVSEAFEMATNIIARRGKGAAIDDETGEEAEEAIVMYYINDGVYGAFNCTMFDHQIVHPKVLTVDSQFISSPSTQTNETTYEPCSVWGPTCDSIDLVSAKSFLPTGDLKVGDWLRWESMGAYTICAASQFNGFKQSKVVYCIDAEPSVEAQIRRFLA